MGRFVEPQTFLIGYTGVDEESLLQYLAYTGQQAFTDDWLAAVNSGVGKGEAMCSFYAKLCYKSLVEGENKNLTKIRNIPDNLAGTFAQGHNSVFQHFMLNFVITDCSRVFTHEAVRHRIGTAFSQTSGRFVRSEELEMVTDPILNPILEDCVEARQWIEAWYNRVVTKIGLPQMKDFDKKKKVTSALRRFLPNGQANEIGFSLNITALRHFIMTRTARASEWEIRVVAGQIYELVKAKFPLMVADAKEREVNDLLEVYGMKMQPYDLTLEALPTADLEAELARRDRVARSTTPTQS